MELVSDLKDMIRLNRRETLLLSKEYLVMYLISLLKDRKGKDNRELLKEKLKEYYLITKCENDYLHFLISNIECIKNFNSLYNLLDKLDELNEKTYLYYDNILKEYEEAIYHGKLDRRFLMPRNFKTLLENDDYVEEVLG